MHFCEAMTISQKRPSCLKTNRKLRNQYRLWILSLAGYDNLFLSVCTHFFEFCREVPNWMLKHSFLSCFKSKLVRCIIYCRTCSLHFDLVLYVVHLRFCDPFLAVNQKHFADTNNVNFVPNVFLIYSKEFLVESFWNLETFQMTSPFHIQTVNVR